MEEFSDLLQRLKRQPEHKHAEMVESWWRDLDQNQKEAAVQTMKDYILLHLKTRGKVQQIIRELNKIC